MVRRVFVGLIRDHRTRIGRIKGFRKKVVRDGCEGKAEDSCE